MGKIFLGFIKTCSECPYEDVRQNSGMMITVFCTHSCHSTEPMYSDEEGDSWKAHKEIHRRCPLENDSHADDDFLKGYCRGVIFGAVQYGGIVVRREDVEIPEGK